MRIITKEAPDHNGARIRGAHAPHLARFLFVALAMSLFLFAGCGNGDSGSNQATSGDDSAGENTSQSGLAHQDGPIRVDIGGWTAFAALAERFDAGETPSLTELTDLGRTESYQAWIACLDQNVPDAARIGRWLEAAYWTELGREGTTKSSTDLGRMRASFLYSDRYRKDIRRQLAEWQDPNYQAEFLADVEAWIEPSRIPNPIILRFLPAAPELRYCRGQLIVDTGVVAAGGNRQLKGQFVAMLYRNLQAIPPAGELTSGEANVVEVFRTLANEGVTTWIEKSPFTFFRPDHFALKKVALIPENFYSNGVSTMVAIHRSLPPLMEDPELMDRFGMNFPTAAAGGGTLAQAGYAMAATIVHHLGESRLREARTSVTAFLAAYQEAALRNPNPQPSLGEASGELALTQAPFDPVLFEQIQSLVAQHYSE